MKFNKIKFYNTIQKVTPPILFLVLKKSEIYPFVKKFANKLAGENSNYPTWNEITDGLLKGRKIFLKITDQWHKEMLNGNYDKFFFDYLKEFNLTGKTIFDIGAHIGFHSLCFAQLVGKNGIVISFEPNIYNKERFKYILTKNEDLSQNIKIHEVAISDRVAEEEFIFSNNIDGGKSSGSFIDHANTFWEKELYEKKMGFSRAKIKTISLDSLSSLEINYIPDIIKIDVEGAEFLVLEGGINLLRNYKPILLIEIHSIFNMFKISQLLNNLNYKIELLKKYKNGRCFISALPLSKI